MKVILLKDVRRVGAHGEVKEVADGFALNMLFPQKLAEPATEAKVAELAKHKAAHDTELAKQEEELTAKVVSLKNKKVTLTARATQKGGLFKAVVAKDVAYAIKAEHGVDIPEGAIDLPEHIKTVGEHAVTLKSKTQKAELVVSIAAAI